MNSFFFCIPIAGRFYFAHNLSAEIEKWWALGWENILPGSQIGLCILILRPHNRGDIEMSSVSLPEPTRPALRRHGRWKFLLLIWIGWLDGSHHCHRNRDIAKGLLSGRGTRDCVHIIWMADREFFSPIKYDQNAEEECNWFGASNLHCGKRWLDRDSMGS